MPCATGLGVLSGLSDDVILGLSELLPAADLARIINSLACVLCYAVLCVVLCYRPGCVVWFVR